MRMREGVQLRALRDAADAQDARESRGLDVETRVLVHLRGELARGEEHERGGEGGGGGARSTAGPRAASAVRSACASGRRYASVLPEPVGAWTRTSRRWTMTARSVRSWTGVRCVMPSARRRALAS